MGIDKAADLDYTLVVPSRRRVHNMPVIRELLPTALVCVDEREVKEYLTEVPEGKLLVHPPLDGVARVMNWMLDAVKTPIFIEIDDDFAGVRVNVGTRRFITDPVEILNIIENACRATQDLGLTAFTFAHSQHTVFNRADIWPVRPVQQCDNCFGVMGAARYRKYDEGLPGRAAVDWTLRTLLEDRCLYVDMRFRFDCGEIFSGAGGNVGLVTTDQFVATSRKLRKRWGKHLNTEAPGSQKRPHVSPLRLQVSRWNNKAQR